MWSSGEGWYRNWSNNCLGHQDKGQLPGYCGGQICLRQHIFVRGDTWQATLPQTKSWLSMLSIKLKCICCTYLWERQARSIFVCGVRLPPPSLLRRVIIPNSHTVQKKLLEYIQQKHVLLPSISEGWNPFPFSLGLSYFFLPEKTQAC